MRLLPIILLLSLAAHGQPGGYTEGTQVCWTFNSRAHGYFRASGWDANTDHILIFFAGDGQTDCSNYDGMQPGLFLRDGAGGSNWNGVTTLPAEAGGGSRKWLVFTIMNHGNQPDVYATDITAFLNTIGITIDASVSGRIHYVGGSGGPGRANGFFNNSTSNPYRTFHSTGIWMSTTLYAVSSNSPSKNYCWYGDADTNPGTPPSFTINVFNQLPGEEGVDKWLGVTAGGTHSNSTWGNCFDISGTTIDDNRWIWMIMYGEELVEIPTYPLAVPISLSTQKVYDMVSSNKPTHRLVDGDTLTWVYPDCADGYIITAFKNQGIWIDLDTFINYPKVEVFDPSDGGGTFSVQFYYSYEDTTRHSPLYSTALPDSAWKGVDTTNSRAWSDSVRFVKVIIGDCIHHVSEIKVYGNKLGVAPSILPDPEDEPDDPGKYFMAYGKLFTDTLMDDAGWTQRIQNSMDNIDTNVVAFNAGKDIVFNKFGNSTNLTLLPSKRMGLRTWHYFANEREAFKYAGIHSKDMPKGADSLADASWLPTYNTYYGVTAKLGSNTSASVAGFTFGNFNAGQGQNLVFAFEIGNEDPQTWSGILKLHDAYVQLTKVKAGYDGIKAADPNTKAISGALTGIKYDRLRSLYVANLIKYHSKNFPADAIALNEYSTTAGGQAQGGSYQGTTPEQFNLKTKLDSLRVIRNRYFPGTELYITEFGYDAVAYTADSVSLDTVNHETNYNVPDISGQNRDQTKAYWTMRWYEIGAAARMSAMAMFSQRDIAGGDFGSTGYSYDIALPGNPSTYLPSYMQQFMEAGRWTSGGCCVSLPKELYWHMTCRRYRLQNYNAWPSVIAQGDSTGVWCLRYTHTSASDSLIYSIWMGTSNNSTTSNYQFSVPNVVSATLVTPALGDKDGTTTALNISGNTITVPTVNEGVQYILVKTAQGASTIRSYFRGSLRNKFIKI